MATGIDGSQFEGGDYAERMGAASATIEVLGILLAIHEHFEGRGHRVLAENVASDFRAWFENNAVRVADLAFVTDSDGGNLISADAAFAVEAEHLADEAEAILPPSDM